MSGKVLVTFDIDGTILRSAGGGKTHTEAISRTANELYGVPLNVDIKEYCKSSFSGTTDSWIAEIIIQTATGRKDVTQEELNVFEEKEYLNYIKLYSSDHKILPGVAECIEKLSKMENVTLGICTGNFVKIGMKKLASVGVEKYFSEEIGGFGDIIERKDIMRHAIETAEKKIGSKFDRIIHIGDAVQDVDAANSNGAIAVAVETGDIHEKGGFPKPCFVLKDLDEGIGDLLSIINTGTTENKECINE